MSIITDISGCLINSKFELSECETFADFFAVGITCPNSNDQQRSQNEFTVAGVSERK